MAWGFQTLAGRGGPGALISVWAGRSLVSWAQASRPFPLEPGVTLQSHLPALSGTVPRILITVPTLRPSGSEVLWGTFCKRPVRGGR